MAAGPHQNQTILTTGKSLDQARGAMVLVHGGGGTAFDAWVRAWVKAGYAAIAMDTCGALPRNTA